MNNIIRNFSASIIVLFSAFSLNGVAAQSCGNVLKKYQYPDLRFYYWGGLTADAHSKYNWAPKDLGGKLHSMFSYEMLGVTLKEPRKFFATPKEQKNFDQVQFLGMDGKKYSLPAGSRIDALLLQQAEVFKDMHLGAAIGRNSAFKFKDGKVLRRLDNPTISADYYNRFTGDYQYMPEGVVQAENPILLSVGMDSSTNLGDKLNVILRPDGANSKPISLYADTNTDAFTFILARKQKLPLSLEYRRLYRATTISFGAKSANTAKDGSVVQLGKDAVLTGVTRYADYPESTIISWEDRKTGESLSATIRSPKMAEKILTALIVEGSIEVTVSNGDIALK